MPMNLLLYYPITVDLQIDGQGSNNVNVSLLLRLQVTFRKSLNLVSLRNFVPAYCVREMANTIHHYIGRTVIIILTSKYV